MEYNKNRETNKYYSLDEILRLNLPDSFLKKVQDNFKKKVFYDNNGSCRLGTLIGLEVDHQLSDVFYIVEVNNIKNYVPIWKSLTKV